MGDIRALPAAFAGGLPSSATIPVRELVIAMTGYGGYSLVTSMVPDKQNWKNFYCWCFASVSAIDHGVRSQRRQTVHTELANRSAYRQITAIIKPLQILFFIIFNQRLITPVQTKPPFPVNRGTQA